MVIVAASLAVAAALVAMLFQPSAFVYGSHSASRTTRQNFTNMVAFLTSVGHLALAISGSQLRPFALRNCISWRAPLCTPGDLSLLILASDSRQLGARQVQAVLGLRLSFL